MELQRILKQLINFGIQNPSGIKKKDFAHFNIQLRRHWTVIAKRCECSARIGVAKSNNLLYLCK